MHVPAPAESRGSNLDGVGSRGELSRAVTSKVGYGLAGRFPIIVYRKNVDGDTPILRHYFTTVSSPETFLLEADKCYTELPAAVLNCEQLYEIKNQHPLIPAYFAYRTRDSKLGRSVILAKLSLARH